MPKAAVLVATLALLITAVTIAVRPAAASPTAYEFRLRGSRSLDISFQKSPIQGFRRLVIRFHASSRPAPSGLRPGEGAWIDRALRPGEPLMLVEDVPENAQCAADYLHSNSNYWTFYMFNTNEGFFRVTRSHFGTPKSY